VPVLVMHGDDDQIVPMPTRHRLSAKLLKNGTLKPIRAFPHGIRPPRPIPSMRPCWLSLQASVPFPTFVSSRSMHFYERRKQRTLASL